MPAWRSRWLLSWMSAAAVMVLLSEAACRTARKQEELGRGPISPLRERLERAIRAHDASAVRRLASSSSGQTLRKAVGTHAQLSVALAWAAGLNAARADLESVCADSRLPENHPDRRKACALAKLAQLANDQPLFLADGASDASIPFLKGIELPIVIAAVDGHTPEPFIVDTGAATSVLSKAYCDRVGIPYVKSVAGVARDGSGKEIALHPTLVGRLDIGGVTIRRWTANVIELGPRLRIGGILSPQDTFRGMAVELDMQSRRLILHRGWSVRDWVKRAGKRVWQTALNWDGGNVFVHGSVGNHAGWFILDSGAGANIVTPELAHATGRTNIGAAEQGVTAAGTATVYQGFDGTLAVGDSAPVHTRLMVKAYQADAEEADPVPVSGYVGLPWMAGRRLLISPDGTELLFTSP